MTAALHTRSNDCLVTNNLAVLHLKGPVSNAAFDALYSLLCTYTSHPSQTPWCTPMRGDQSSSLLPVILHAYT
jgi:hypothetical protein